MAAITADKVVVELEAKLDRYNADVKRAESTFNRSMSGISSAAVKAQSSVVGSVRAIAGAYLGIQGARMAQQLVDAGTRITNSLKVAGLEGQNLTKVYDSLFASAQRNAVPIEALAQLYGRVAIVQKELGVSTERLTLFTDNVATALRVAGTDATSASGALLQLSQALGAGTVRAEEFNSILEGALPVAQAAAAGLEEAGGSVAKLRKLVIDGKVSSAAFFAAFEAGAVTLAAKVATTSSTIEQGYTRIQNALIDAARRMNESSKGGQQLAGALDTLALAIQKTDFGPLARELAIFITDITKATNELITFIGWLQKLPNSDAVKSILGTSSNERVSTAFDRSAGSMNGGLAPYVSDAGGGPDSRGGRRAVSSNVKTVSLTDPGMAAEATAKKGKENAYARELRQLEEKNRLMTVELGLVSATQKERDKALMVQELENAALQGKIPLTATINKQIDEAAEKYANLAESLRNAEDRQAAINELMQTFGDVATDVFLSLFDSTKSWTDALGDGLKMLAKMAAQAAFTGGGPLGQLFGLAGKDGKTGGLFGSLAGLFKAKGGPVSQGQPYIVGEKGPELMVPGQSGMVVPNNRLGSSGGSTGGTTVVMNNDFRGVTAADRAYTDQKLKQLEGQIAGMPQALPGVWNKRPGLR